MKPINSITKNHILVIFTLFNISVVFGQTINVPIDYNNPEIGNFNLGYEFGNTYNPNLPTVIVIADAQQFYVKPGRIKKIQEELFGSNFNVLGLIPRSFNEDLLEKIVLHKAGKTNWKLAYSVFKSYQFVNDIDQVINKVLANQNGVYLYGQSGGAFLITEYLSVFPHSKVKKVFIAASVNPVIESKLGIIHDHFQRDYLLNNESDKIKLDTILNDGFFNRKLVANLFQRQNFFVGLPMLNKERSELINRLYIKDSTYINQLKNTYQINAINRLLNSEMGIPIRVRLTEFIYPLLKKWATYKNGFYPDLENSYNMAYPLLNLQNTSDFEISNVFNENEFRKYKGEVFILSGRYDHVADYRASIYLNGLLENSTLFIADDDHTFKSLKSNKKYANLIQDFLMPKHKKWLLNYKAHQWTEN